MNRSDLALSVPGKSAVRSMVDSAVRGLDLRPVVPSGSDIVDFYGPQMDELHRLIGW